MRPAVFVVGLVLCGGLMLAGSPAAAHGHGQTYGQPYYPGADARRWIGEAQTRAYAATGDQADGHGYVPRPIVPQAHDRGGRYGYSPGPYRRHVPAPRYGYRDDWGYQDDRPPSRFRSARSWRQGQAVAARECACDDGYLYDR